MLAYIDWPAYEFFFSYISLSGQVVLIFLTPSESPPCLYWGVAAAAAALLFPKKKRSLKNKRRRGSGLFVEVEAPRSRAYV